MQEHKGDLLSYNIVFGMVNIKIGIYTNVIVWITTATQLTIIISLSIRKLLQQRVLSV